MCYRALCDEFKTKFPCKPDGTWGDHEFEMTRESDEVFLETCSKCNLVWERDDEGGCPRAYYKPDLSELSDIIGRDFPA